MEMRKVKLFVAGISAVCLFATGAFAVGEKMGPGPSLTPDQALQMLIDGNKRFVESKQQKTDLSAARRDGLAKEGQHPFAAILSCADSRVPPEHVFNQGLGDLFVLRVAGNVLVPVVTGSIEFSQSLEVPLVVVMGHDSCGAVQATVEGARVGPNIAAIAEEIRPALEAVKAGKSVHKDDNLQEAVTSENVGQMVARLKSNPDLAPRIEAGKLKVVGAKYILETGEVEFFK